MSVRTARPGPRLTRSLRRLRRGRAYESGLALLLAALAGSLVAVAISRMGR